MANKRVEDNEKQQTAKPPFENIVANYPFHDFEAEPKFTGTYINTEMLGEDEEKQFKANVFADIESGEMFYLSNSYSINKAIQLAKAKFQNLSEVVFMIEFLGKTEIKGKPFNQFKIGTCTLEQYKDFYAV
jgi:hypothetical protein